MHFSLRHSVNSVSLLYTMPSTTRNEVDLTRTFDDLRAIKQPAKGERSFDQDCSFSVRPPLSPSFFSGPLFME